MTIPKGLAARAVIETNTQKAKMVIEVKEGNRFSNFYSTYTTVGRGRHRLVIPGLPRHRGFADSLEDTVEQLVHVMQAHARRQGASLSIRTTIRIHRKRLYRKLLAMRPDELGLTHITSLPDPRLIRAGLIQVANSLWSPCHTPLARRWQIITGAR
jgi:hypothetical protein